MPSTNRISPPTNHIENTVVVKPATLIIPIAYATILYIANIKEIIDIINPNTTAIFKGAITMNEEVQKSLNRACQYKMTGEYREALKIFDKQFSQNPDEFREIHKTDYAWTIYRVSVQNFRSEDELFESAEFITNLIAQKDITKNKSDPYTSAVFKVINHLNSNEEYYEMPYWLEKIDPKLLDVNKYKRYGRWNKSKRERFYDLASKTYLQCGDYEKCIEISTQALESMENFVDDADVWYRWRIAKSLFNLNQFNESLEYAIEVTKSKPEWYVYNMIAKIYQRLN